MPIPPTIKQLFGTNAELSADGLTLTIKTADLAATGLVPSGTASADSLAVALFLNWLANQDVSADAVVQMSKPDSGAIIPRGQVNYLRDRYYLDLWRTYTQAPVNPGNYA